MHRHPQLHHCDLPPGFEVQITVCMHGGVAESKQTTQICQQITAEWPAVRAITPREYSLFTTACTRLDPTPTMPAPSAPHSSETNLSGKGKGAEGEKNE